jgi:hypothetical protein
VRAESRHEWCTFGFVAIADFFPSDTLDWLQCNSAEIAFQCLQSVIQLGLILPILVKIIIGLSVQGSHPPINCHKSIAMIAFTMSFTTSWTTGLAQVYVIQNFVKINLSVSLTPECDQPYLFDRIFAVLSAVSSSVVNSRFRS